MHRSDKFDHYEIIRWETLVYVVQISYVSQKLIGWRNIYLDFYIFGCQHLNKYIWQICTLAGCVAIFSFQTGEKWISEINWNFVDGHWCIFHEPILTHKVLLPKLNSKQGPKVAGNQGRKRVYRSFWTREIQISCKKCLKNFIPGKPWWKPPCPCWWEPP